MTRTSNGYLNLLALRLFTLLVGVIGGSLLFLTGCTPPPEEGVVALVNGRQITQTEFEARWGELAEATKARYEKEGGKRRFLDELITRELLMQEARKLGLDQNDAIRDRAQRYREQLILDELLKDRIKTKIELSNEELDAFYEQHAQELLTPLKVRVSQMLLPNISAAKDLEKQINQGGALRPICTALFNRRKIESERGRSRPLSQGLGRPRSRRSHSDPQARIRQCAD
jgi:hypothetical protein